MQNSIALLLNEQRLGASRIVFDHMYLGYLLKFVLELVPQTGKNKFVPLSDLFKTSPSTGPLYHSCNFGVGDPLGSWKFTPLP